MPQREHAHVQAGVQTVNLNSKVSLWRRELYSWLFVDSFHFFITIFKETPAWNEVVPHWSLHFIHRNKYFSISWIGEGGESQIVCLLSMFCLLATAVLASTNCNFNSPSRLCNVSVFPFFLPSFLSFFIGSTHNEQHNWPSCRALISLDDITY